MKFYITWQLVVIIAIISLCITGIEIYAVSQGLNGTVLSLAIGSLVGIPSVLLIRRARHKKVE